MIFGQYPCCGADLAIPMPEQTPKYLPENCPACGAKVWHVLSRACPESFTEDDFLQRYEVNHETKTIRERERVIASAEVQVPASLAELDAPTLEAIIRQKLQEKIRQILSEYPELLTDQPTDQPSRPHQPR